ncbi:MAG: amino acid adenylation domain-containing protein [Pseudomonadales bacterium]
MNEQEQQDELAPESVGIAVVGMSLKFPGAQTPEQYWDNLCNGVESIERFDEAALRQAGIDPELIADPNFVRARGLFEGPELFDPAFFGISVRDAELMDPQQRVFLESCWSALEDSGYAADRYEGAIGVWGGMSTGMTNNTYLLANLHSNGQKLAAEDQLPAMLGNENDYLTTRVSFKLNLTGPSINVQTACSTSLVAITQAYQSLMLYGCDMALAGGVSVSYPQQDGYIYQEGGIGSPDGHCRPFDARAEGTVFSNGCGVVVLKRVEDAIADGDTIYAVVRGAAMNNDGAAKMSFAAPSVAGQAEVIASAQAIADVDAASVGYVECHGTATPIGDPIEIAALTQAFRETTDARGYCAVGSVKSNFGHLDSAAGVAAFIKTVLALHHGKVPPTLHYQTPNPQIDFAGSPFFVADQLQEWPTLAGPRRAGVSAFGIGGTNAHIVLEQAPVAEASAASQQAVESASAVKPQLLWVSGKTKTALAANTERLAEYLERDGSELALTDVAHTLRNGRSHFAHRLAVVTSAIDQAPALLRGADRGLLANNKALPGAAGVALLFPGGGSQYVDMGRDLLSTQPVFAQWVERGLELYQDRTGIDLRAVWYSPNGVSSEAATEFERPSLQLPAIFIAEYAMAMLWRSWGLTPTALLGHSMGENTAACVAGVMSFEDALGLVTLRGQLFESVQAGGMLSIAMSAAEAQPYLHSQLDLATINAPEQCTISGPVAALDALELRLQEDDVDYQRVPIAIAAHSSLLDPILPAFRDYLASIKLSPPSLAVVSNLTGTWLTGEQATSPDYWVSHLRNTVRFADCIDTVVRTGECAMLEVGPGKILGSLARLQVPEMASRIVASMRHPADAVADEAALLNAANSLWTSGVDLDWESVVPVAGSRRVRLPSYAFARNRHLIEPVLAAPAAAPVSNDLPVPQPFAQSPAGVAPAAVQPPSGTIEKPPMQSRFEYIADRLATILQELSGRGADEIDSAESFVDMGFDSLFLTQANLRFKKEFKVKVTFRQLFEDAPTINALAQYIDAQLPEEALADQLQASAPADNVTPQAPQLAPQPSNLVPGTASVGSGDALQQAIAMQVQASNAMLQLLATMPGANAAPSAAAPAAAPTTAGARGIEFEPTTQRPAATGRFGPFKPVQKNLSGALSDAQQQYLDAFIERYVGKTSGSKQYTQDNRAHYADPRAVAGFKQAWKEITYPIVSDRSRGARVWDVDGNEYIDCAGGFGATFFGHAPEFIMDAVRKQLDISVDYGPQSTLSGPTAKLICELTGHDRASFCNTGSEAVLAAMRIARTVTGNEKIVSFAGSYHGMFDEVLVRPQDQDGVRQNKPIAPGIPEQASQNMIVLEYGDPQSLRYLETIMDDIAAVIVEPIQSRSPELQPVEFVKALRTLTAQHEVPLIFDEIITGFRLHPRGAQHWFGVDADLCAYGKVVGGGMPVGVIAGNAELMDTLDGGGWQYGDDSFPEAGVTYFAGTFVRHPTAIAAVHAAMSRLKEAGPALQEGLNQRTAAFCEQVNRSYHALGVPIELTYFSSVFLPRFYGNPDYESLFFHHLRWHGAHIWEGRPGFFTTEHGAEELSALHDMFVAAAEDMRDAGFLPEAVEQQAVVLPFSPAQSELYLALALGSDACSAYNEQVLFELDGTLNRGLLELTLDKVVNRHESLRSVVGADEASTSVLPYVQPQVEWLDLSDSTDVQAADSAARAAARENVDRNFDLRNGPLVRLLVIELGADRCWLALTASHLVCDGWSLEIIMQDLAQYYRAMCDGRQIDRGVPPTLAEFQALAAERVASGEVADAGKYWLDVYRTPPEPTNLPFDRERPPLKTYRGERVAFSIEPELADGLRDFAKEQGCTLFTVTLAAFNLFIEQLSGSQDFVVGIPAAGQPAIGLPDLVAHDVSFLPVRIKLDPQQSVTQMLAATRAVFADAQGNTEFAFGDLLQQLRLQRDPSRMPLVTAAFNMDQEMSPLYFSEQQARFLTTPRSYVKYDLFLNLIDLGGSRGVDVELDFNQDLLSEATAQQWFVIYQQLLEAILARPDALVCAVQAPALLESQRSNVAAQMQAPDGQVVPVAADVTLLSLFAASVAEHPDREALRFNGAAMTYKELDTASNQLANLLHEQGVTLEDRVAIVLHRSFEMLIAVYGVLKAGATYVPLDPESPAERMAQLINDCDARCVLTQQSALSFLPASPLSIVLDGTKPDYLAHSAVRPALAVTAATAAYVIYTSGSTGTPKGVLVEHGAIANRLLWAQSRFQMQPGERFLHKTPYTFDVSVVELFWPLQVGGTLVIAQPDGHKDPDYLYNTLRDEAVSCVHFVPSMLQAFNDAAVGKVLPGLQQIYCSGEALRSVLVTQIMAIAAQARVYNLYGPTEAAVDVSCFDCTDGPFETEHMPIGKAVANTQLLVLDEQGAAVSTGGTGELYITGAQLARGYLGQADLTDARFVALDIPGFAARAYRTGDLVTLLPSGDLLFVGRNDDQVKVRGHRIELGEIEAVLAEVTGVDAVCVVKQVVAAGDERLVAFVKSATGDAISQLALRQRVRERLPLYMMPQQFVSVAEFPTSSSGKLDRKRLLNELTGAAAEAPETAQLTATEERIAAIWQRVIKLQPGTVRSADNFFDIGGHSLLAMEALRDIQAELQVRLTLRDLLYDPLASVAQKVDTAEAVDTEQPPSSAKGAGVASNDSGLFRKVLGMFPDNDR